MANTMESKDDRRRARETNICHQSEMYGMRFCSQNAHLIGPAVSRWCQKDTSAADGIEVRVYNRTENVMYMTSLTNVLDSFVYDADGKPQRLNPTAFGQVTLGPTLYLSSTIYYTLVAVWHSVRTA